MLKSISLNVLYTQYYNSFINIFIEYCYSFFILTLESNL